MMKTSNPSTRISLGATEDWLTGVRGRVPMGLRWVREFLYGLADASGDIGERLVPIDP